MISDARIATLEAQLARVEEERKFVRSHRPVLRALDLALQRIEELEEERDAAEQLADQCMDRAVEAEDDLDDCRALNAQLRGTVVSLEDELAMCRVANADLTTAFDQMSWRLAGLEK